MATDNLRGVFFGTVLTQQSGSIGGSRAVFVKLQGSKNELVFPTFGGILKNIKAPMKFYAGDLMEYRTNEDGVKPEIYLLRTFKVAKQSSSTTTVQVERDGYKHIPFVGDVLMKAPEEIGGTGNPAYTVTKVEAKHEGSKDVWELTFGTTLGELQEGDILVEAESENASGTMLVKNINAVSPSDNDCIYSPVATNNTTDAAGAKYIFAPALGGVMYINKMSPVPACVLKLNKCNVNGWFKVGF